MSDQADSMAGPGSQSAPVNDPPPVWKIQVFGGMFLSFSFLVFYLLVATWPVLIPDPSVSVPAGATPKVFTFKPFRLFALGPYSWATDLRMLLTVILAGTIGSLIHTLTSFGDYVGNKRLGTSWMWWFVLRTPIGISLALVAYLILRGGLIAPTLHAPKDAEDLQGATVLLNPYGIAAFAALAGMFSRQATDKLREVFETLFTAQRAVPRGEPLRGKPTVGVTPEKLTRGNPQVLAITGRGFDKGAKATIDGKPRDVQWINDTQIRVAVIAEDVSKAGRIELLITNNDELFVVPIEVEEPAAVTISGPAELSKQSTSLIAEGKGFQAGCTATVNGQDRKPSSIESKKITIPLEAGDLTSDDLQLVIKNPDGGSAEIKINLVQP